VKLSDRSEKNLIGVHPDLNRVVRRAAELCGIDEFGFVVIEGVRTLERQKQLLAQGASKTLKSRHITGHAVDLAVQLLGEIRWDWPLYTRLAKVVKEAAQIEGVPIEWGGDWINFKDGPHFQLTATKYPESTSWT
jgi:peptidoglycan L-alanyl-D-glutamate endopeptidase CwlK